jgi:hypothetical protein
MNDDIRFARRVILFLLALNVAQSILITVLVFT